MAMQSSVETVTGGMVRRIGRFGQSLDDLGRQGDGATNALQPTQAELRWALVPACAGEPARDTRPPAIADTGQHTAVAVGRLKRFRDPRS